MQFSQPVWWATVVVVGILVIVAFEIGFSAGERHQARLHAAASTETAAATPENTSPKPGIVASTPAPIVAPKDSPAKSDAPSKPPTTPTPASRPRDASVKATETPRTSERPAEKPVAVKFESDILPIFQSKCISCHGGLSKRGGLDLRSLSAVTRGGNSGPALKPGQPDDSPVWQTVKSGQMPPSNKPQLTADEKRAILTWVAGGGR